MRAAVLWPDLSTLSIEDISISEPRGSEVLVRIAEAGICGSDIHALSGRMASPRPAVLGHEASGIVEACGPEVTAVRPGDHVVLCQSSFCGICEFCLKGRTTLCRAPGLRNRADGTARLESPSSPLAAASGIGAFAEYALVHERSTLAIPKSVPLRTAAVLGCAVVTGMGAVLRTAHVEAGSTVAVVGAGPVGVCAIQAARIAGATQVIAVDNNATRLAAANEYGATATLDPGDTDVVAAVRELTDGGVEYSFEAVGHARTVEQSFSMLRPTGVCTVMGIVPNSTSISIFASELLSERRLQGSANGSNRFHLDVPRYLSLYQQGRLLLDELVGQVVSLDTISHGIDLVAKGEGGRTMLTFDR